MGRYSLTPFGIHKDQEHTFLYHFGPGIKKAGVWDPAIKDIALVMKSDSFNLLPGDGGHSAPGGCIIYSTELVSCYGKLVIFRHARYCSLLNQKITITDVFFV